MGGGLFSDVNSWTYEQLLGTIPKYVRSER